MIREAEREWSGLGAFKGKRETFQKDVVINSRFQNRLGRKRQQCTGQFKKSTGVMAGVIPMKQWEQKPHIWTEEHRRKKMVPSKRCQVKINVFMMRETELVWVQLRRCQGKGRNSTYKGITDRKISQGMKCKDRTSWFLTVSFSDGEVVVMDETNKFKRQEKWRNSHLINSYFPCRGKKKKHCHLLSVIGDMDDEYSCCSYRKRNWPGKSEKDHWVLLISEIRNLWFVIWSTAQV